MVQLLAECIANAVGIPQTSTCIKKKCRNFNVSIHKGQKERVADTCFHLDKFLLEKSGIILRQMCQTTMNDKLCRQCKI